LVGEPSKAAKSRVRWRHKTSFDDMVQEMVAADLAAVAIVADVIGYRGRFVFDTLTGTAEAFECLRTHAAGLARQDP
jgi:hypothetical protein